jgi:hypothetical protein
MWLSPDHLCIYSFFLAGDKVKSFNFAGMKKLKRILVMMILVISTMLSVSDLHAQCPMCKMSAESNLKNGGTTGRGLNTGILYMLALPYTLLGTFGYIWWRNNRRKEEDQAEDQQ